MSDNEEQHKAEDGGSSEAASAAISESEEEVDDTACKSTDSESSDETPKSTDAQNSDATSESELTVLKGQNKSPGSWTTEDTDFSLEYSSSTAEAGSDPQEDPLASDGAGSVCQSEEPPTSKFSGLMARLESESRQTWGPSTSQAEPDVHDCAAGLAWPGRDEQVGEAACCLEHPMQEEADPSWYDDTELDWRHQEVWGGWQSEDSDEERRDYSGILQCFNVKPIDMSSNGGIEDFTFSPLFDDLDMQQLAGPSGALGSLSAPICQQASEPVEQASEPAAGQEGEGAVSEDVANWMHLYREVLLHHYEHLARHQSMCKEMLRLFTTHGLTDENEHNQYSPHNLFQMEYNSVYWRQSYQIQYLRRQYDYLWNTSRWAQLAKRPPVIGQHFMTLHLLSFSCYKLIQLHFHNLTEYGNLKEHIFDFKEDSTQEPRTYDCLENLPMKLYVFQYPYLLCEQYGNLLKELPLGECEDTKSIRQELSEMFAPLVAQITDTENHTFPIPSEVVKQAQQGSREGGSQEEGKEAEEPDNQIARRTRKDASSTCESTDEKSRQKERLEKLKAEAAPVRSLVEMEEAVWSSVFLLKSPPESEDEQQLQALETCMELVQAQTKKLQIKKPREQIRNERRMALRFKERAEAQQVFEQLIKKTDDIMKWLKERKILEKFKQSLKQRCIDVIARNLGYYRYKLLTEWDPFYILPVPVKTALIERVGQLKGNNEGALQRFRDAALLVGVNTERLNLDLSTNSRTRTLAWSAQSVEWIFKRILVLCPPTLVELHLKLGHSRGFYHSASDGREMFAPYRRGCDVFQDIAPERGLFRDTLCCLYNLRVLVLRGHNIMNRNLGIIRQNCPLLMTLDVSENKFISFIGVNLLCGLYPDGGPKPKLIKLNLLATGVGAVDLHVAVQNLPTLRLLQHEEVGQAALLYEEEEQPLALQYLQIQEHAWTLQDVETVVRVMPDVRHLELHTLESTKPLLELEKVTTLHIQVSETTENTTQNIDSLLSSYSESLTDLSLMANCKLEVDLSQIGKQCLPLVSFGTNLALSLKPKYKLDNSHFTKLKNFTVFKCEAAKDVTSLPEEVIMVVLSSPSLESFSVHGLEYPEKAVSSVVGRARDGEPVLGQLKELRVLHQSPRLHAAPLLEVLSVAFRLEKLVLSCSIASPDLRALHRVVRSQGLDLKLQPKPGDPAERICYACGQAVK